MNIINIIESVLSEILDEANLKNDMKFYNEAKSFYDKMIIKLKNNDFITQPDGSVLFKGSEIDNKYSDLLILIVSKNKKFNIFGNFISAYAFAYHKNNKVIITPVLTDDIKSVINIDDRSFIHEFIHYLDSERNNNLRNKNKGEALQKETYYNNPKEFNAYYQEIVGYVVNDLLKNKTLLDKFKNKFTTFELFYKWMISQVIDQDFISYLNNDNERKLKKRLYNIYNEYF